MLFRGFQALRIIIVVTAAVFLWGAVSPTEAGEVELTIVNIETPQGVKVWEPESVYAKQGDKVTLTLINKLDKEHGYQIEAYGIKEVVDGMKTKKVSFTADKAGVFPIKCHLHPPHVAGQLVVLGP
jgi:nitrosocyanin